MSALPLEEGLFGRLRRDTGPDWTRYVRHGFVQQLGAATLAKPAFQHFLKQDYLFLIHFARAKALAVFKAESIPAMVDKTNAIQAILAETSMHLKYCEGWGLSQAEVLGTAESAETVSYTRYVIDRGLAGDILDLEVALVPCSVGYAEVALRILADPNRKLAGNPYQSWIDTYGAESYQALARAAAKRIDDLGVSHGGEARFPMLSATFSEAARLEQRFWQQGLDAAG